MIRSEYLQQLKTYMKDMKEGCLSHKVDYRLAVPGEGAEGVLSDFLLDRLRGHK